MRERQERKYANSKLTLPNYDMQCIQKIESIKIKIFKMKIFSLEVGPFRGVGRWVGG